MPVKAGMFVACVVLFFVEGISGYYDVSTNVHRHYQPIELLFDGSAVFKVQARTDAHIVLFSTWGGSFDGPEIVIGGWGDVGSAIRTTIGAGNRIYNHNGRLNQHAFESFWIRWNSSEISVGSGEIIGDGQFMQTALDVSAHRFIAVGTYTVTGQWKIGAECSIEGDPHVTSDDGYHYWVPTGNGVYVLEKTTLSPNITIYGVFSECEVQKSCLHEMFFSYMGHDVTLSTSALLIDGDVVTGTTHTADWALMMTPASGNNVMVMLSGGLTVVWNYRKTGKVITPMSLRGHTRGLCGTYNDVKSDERTLPDGRKAPDLVTFLQAWSVP